MALMHPYLHPPPSRGRYGGGGLLRLRCIDMGLDVRHLRYCYTAFFTTSGPIGFVSLLDTEVRLFLSFFSFSGLPRESKKTMDRRVKHGDDRMLLWIVGSLQAMTTTFFCHSPARLGNPWIVGSILRSEPVLNLIGDLDGSDNDNREARCQKSEVGLQTHWGFRLLIPGVLPC